MEKVPEKFGDYIKRIRKSREVTLEELAKYLGLPTLSQLSDIESNRRNPFSGERLELFIKKFGLKPEEQAKLYDLAAREVDGVPKDIEETFMYTEAGDFARLALRRTQSGSITVEDWKKFIQDTEGKK